MAVGHLNRHWRYPGEESNSGLLEYEEFMLETQPRLSIGLLVYSASLVVIYLWVRITIVK